MANCLTGETSPYLRQHADNPVNWYPWGEEAFSRARAEETLDYVLREMTDPQGGFYAATPEHFEQQQNQKEG